MNYYTVSNLTLVLLVTSPYKV